MQETAGNAVLPFYILCDESGSMDANGGIDAVNKGLPELHAAIAGDPLVSDKCRIGLITFSDIAEELLPLSNLSDVQAMPGCAAKGMTNYGEAFNLLRVVISRDIANMKSQGIQVYRPAVFFITDGEPTDDWEANHRALTDKNVNPQAPHIIAFGVAGANPAVIGKIGTKAAFIANQGVDPGNALKEILKSLTNTIVNSSSSSSPTLMVQQAPPGTTAVPLDTM
jgi:uncharacterized protein YegL